MTRSCTLELPPFRRSSSPATRLTPHCLRQRPPPRPRSTASPWCSQYRNDMAVPRLDGDGHCADQLSQDGDVGHRARPSSLTLPPSCSMTSASELPPHVSTLTPASARDSLQPCGRTGACAVGAPWPRPASSTLSAADRESAGARRRLTLEPEHQLQVGTTTVSTSRKYRQNRHR